MAGKKRLKVYFKTAAPTVPSLRQQFLNPPPGVEYIPCTETLYPQGNVNTRLLKSDSNPVKNIASKVLEHVDPFEVTKVPFFVPLTVDDDIDLIHSWQYLLKANKPWVVSFEEISVFAHYKPYIHSAMCKKILAKWLVSDKCKTVLPFTHAAKEGMFHLLKDSKHIDEIRRKTDVVYKTVTPKKPFVRKKKKEVSVLFVGRLFYQKGAYELVRSFPALKKANPNIRMRIISNIPQDVMQKYGKLEGLELIQTGPKVTDGYIDESYRWADIFAFPTHMDTLGYVLIEATSYGLPIVSVNQMAVPELVKHGETGLIVKNPYSDHENFIKAFPPLPEMKHPLIEEMKNPPAWYLKDLQNAILTLANDETLRQKMSKKCFEVTHTGHLSPKVNGEKLRRIYDEALQK